MILISRLTTIDQIDLIVLHELLNNPIQSWRSIAHKTDLSQNDIRKSYYKMKKGQILNPDGSITDTVFGKRSISEVQSEYDPRSIGLQRTFLLISNYNTNETSIIRQALRNHPYVQMIAHAASIGMHIIAILDIPKDTGPKIQEYAKLLEEISGGEVFVLNNLTYQTSSYFDFELLKLEKSSSNQQSSMYDFSSIEPKTGLTQKLWERYKFSFDNFETIKESIAPFDSNPETKEFDNLDLNLIRELSINAKVPNKDLAELYDLHPSTISKRINKVKNNYIRGYRLLFDHDKFNLNSYILVGKFGNSMITPTDLFRFVKMKIPYKSKLISNGNTFFWQITASHEIALDTYDFISNNFDDAHFLSIIPRTLYRYYFQPMNYIMGEGWQDSEEHMVEDPIAQSIDGRIKNQYLN